MGKSRGKSWTGDMGEKLERVVGFGASNECGGLLLGFRTGGERGSGMRLG